MNKCCTWIGNGEGCTHTVVEGRNYCEEHLWKVYQQGTELVKKRKKKNHLHSVYFWELLFLQAIEELESEGWNPEEYMFE
jgi:hypothetical protein